MQAQEILKNENIKPMFPYIENIYQLHQEILEKFKLRIKTWWAKEYENKYQMKWSTQLILVLYKIPRFRL